MQKVGVVCNYNLDSAVASILLERFYGPIHEFKCGGRGRLDAMLTHMFKENATTIILVGFSMSSNVAQHFRQKKVSVICYETEEELANRGRSPIPASNGCMFHVGKSVSAAVAKDMLKRLTDINKQDRFTKVYIDLVLAATAYATWDVKGDNFRLGHALNTLFFKMGMWDFRKEFAYGTVGNYKISSNCLMLLKRCYKERDKQIFGTIPTVVGEESALFSCGGEYIDDYGLAIPGFASYHILRKDDKNNAYALSSRLSHRKEGEKLNLHNSYEKVKQQYANQPIFKTAWGNKHAYGIMFAEHAKIEDVIKFVDDYSKIIETNRC